MISIKPSRKGLLHQKLGVPQGQPIPAAKIAKAKASTSPALRKEATFAQNAKHFNHGGDNRAGRLSSVKTDRGAFRFKANRKGD